MDKRRLELEELQDEIHLALLMDEYAESFGAKARAEAENAFENGGIAIPQEADDACRSILAQTAKAGSGKKPAKALSRTILVAAATAVILLGSMVIAQAAGLNVFGKLASWTDSVFHFGVEKSDPEGHGSEEASIQQEESVIIPEIKAALDELDIPDSLAPIWLPDGYTVTDVKKSNTSRKKTAAIAAEGNGPMIQIFIGEYSDEKMIEKMLWEKDSNPVQIFVSNGRSFYLFKNSRSWSGAWSDGQYLVSVMGVQTAEELKTIIISIGADSH